MVPLANALGLRRYFLSFGAGIGGQCRLQGPVETRPAHACGVFWRHPAIYPGRRHHRSMREQLLIRQWSCGLWIFLPVPDAGEQTPNQVLGSCRCQRWSVNRVFQDVQCGTLVKRRLMGSAGDIGLQLGDLESLGVDLPSAEGTG